MLHHNKEVAVQNCQHEFLFSKKDCHMSIIKLAQLVAHTRRHSPNPKTKIPAGAA
jgi:hypothetical protein